jgi:taurine dioxygenase
LDVVRCQPTIGAEIRGLDLSRPLDDAAFDSIREALLEHKVIFFRNQSITQEQQIAFGQRFGPLEINPFRPQGEGKPELQIVKNDEDNPVLSTDVWHADLTFRAKPTKFTVLRCLEMPASGGDTLWADMCAAYDGLSASLREFITGLEAVHDFKNFRILYKGDPDQLKAMEDSFPNPTFTLRVDGMSDHESRQLLELLYEQAHVPEYQFRLKWEPETVAIWDNRSCQHYAVNDYYPNRRHMERVAVAGDAEPFFDAAAEPARPYASINRVHAYEGLG